MNHTSITTGSAGSSIPSGVSVPVPSGGSHRGLGRRWPAVGAVLAVVMVLTGLPVTGAATTAAAATGVSHPATVVVTGGSLGFGGIDVPLPDCTVGSDGCISLPVTVGPSGGFTSPPDVISLPELSLPLDELGVDFGIPLTVGV